MHIYFLQHDDRIGPARLTDWLTGMGHSYNGCRLHAGELPPRLEDCDALIILDAPMDLTERDAPWLKRERKLIARALKSGKPVLGLGFGARLIAEGLGAITSRGTYAEIGWHRVDLAPESAFDLPEQFDAFMWHHDIFGLPDGALPLGGSEASPLQGFSWDAGRVIALQCHLEATAQSAAALLDHTPPNATGSTAYVQSREQILESPRRFDQLASLLDRVLLRWLGSVTF
ncbi:MULTISPECIES: type 1 glutamine amidotransferase [Halomonadaceae]|uniref:type 1 glutamine amidotransferase n=1 Tax=Halomonadaceae TaxID=28256 RepID=UPI0015990039|nr:MULTISPECIES: type 1 glutamine amidotransferase [Halomonas]QJQ94970.1 type 1 glutamine amidotransferase [Halomonas sp. PA5]